MHDDVGDPFGLAAEQSGEAVMLFGDDPVSLTVELGVRTRVDDFAFVGCRLRDSEVG